METRRYWMKASGFILITDALFMTPKINLKHVAYYSKAGL